MRFYAVVKTTAVAAGDATAVRVPIFPRRSAARRATSHGPRTLAGGMEHQETPRVHYSRRLLSSNPLRGHDFRVLAVQVSCSVRFRLLPGSGRVKGSLDYCRRAAAVGSSTDATDSARFRTEDVCSVVGCWPARTDCAHGICGAYNIIV